MDTAAEPHVIDLEPAHTAVIRATVPMAELRDFFDRSFGELAAVLGQQGVTPASAPFARYYGMPAETVELEVGFPTPTVVTAEGSVQPGSLPGGRVAHLTHRGSYEALGESWGRLAGWIVEQGSTPGSAFWEVYVTEPTPDMDPAELITELYWSLDG